MEAQSEPKPKRKFVMTPERHAKLMANLAKARLAPKEKVYRKTPKRYAANIGNLAKANAKVRQQAEELRAKVEGLFPAPEVPPLAPPSDCPSGAEELDQATVLIARRLRKVHAATRREGRRIMRVLTAAISRSHPLSPEEACNLVRELLQCLDGSRVAAEARRLNHKIAELLVKMLVARYGAEAQVNGFPLADAVEQEEEEQRQRAAARLAARESRAAQERQATASSETAAAPPEGELAQAVEGEADAGQGPGEFERQGAEPINVSVPELPQTVEEFERLLGRALDLEGESHHVLLTMLVSPLWERLHWWQGREQKETQTLDQLFQEGGATPPGSFENLLNRMFDINIFLELPRTFVGRMNLPTAGLEENLEWFLERRARIIESRGRESPVPARPPVRATSNEPAGGSEDTSAVA